MKTLVVESTVGRPGEQRRIMSCMLCYRMVYDSYEGGDLRAHVFDFKTLLAVFEVAWVVFDVACCLGVPGCCSMLRGFFEIVCVCVLRCCLNF